MKEELKKKIKEDMAYFDRLKMWEIEMRTAQGDDRHTIYPVGPYMKGLK